MKEHLGNDYMKDSVFQKDGSGVVNFSGESRNREYGKPDRVRLDKVRVREYNNLEMDKAFDCYADLLIQKLESAAKTQWEKPWFTEGQLARPKSLYGKAYHGMNALMLAMYCERENYKIPVFATRDRIFGMNFNIDASGHRVPAVDNDGDKLPFLHISKGEHSFPVFLSQANVVNRETKEKISWSDYVNLGSEEQKDYKVYYNFRVHHVFNVDQTNMQEARPELYQKLIDENVPKDLGIQESSFCFKPLDVMVTDRLWICDIKPTYGDDAYYSLKEDKIVIPTKEQFVKSGKPEAYYGTMLHEMIHSTGAAHHLDRLKPGLERDAYAREELVAELGSAITCLFHGFAKFIKDDTIPYVQSWLDALHEKADFIRTVLKDIKMATSFVDVRINAVEKYILDKESDKIDARFDTESTLELDEKGDFYLGIGESLGVDKKQGEGENRSKDKSDHESVEHKTGFRR